MVVVGFLGLRGFQGLVFGAPGFLGFRLFKAFWFGRVPLG